LLTLAERAALFAFPETDGELIRHYSLSEADRAAARPHRTPALQRPMAGRL
jgi:hypothetical protein